MRPKLIAALVLALIVGTFAFQNTEVVELEFVVWKLSMSRALVVIGVFALGFGAGWLAHAFWRRRAERAPASPSTPSAPDDPVAES